VKAVQCNNDREFDNSPCTFFLTHWTHLHMSYPYTSPQNCRAERIIRTINNVVRSLLFQASMPPSYWVEGMHIATHLLNILPTKTLVSSTPHLALFGVPPSYDHLRVFGCACYPNLSSTAAHKLAQRSTLCVFLDYSAHHKGYRCLDLQSNRVIISRHVFSMKPRFRFPGNLRHPVPDFEFLVDETNPVPVSIGPVHSILPAGPPPGDSA